MATILIEWKGNTMVANDWKNAIKRNLPKIGPITNKTISCTLENAGRFRGAVRASMGRIWTNKDFEARRKRVLNTRLP